MIYLDSIVRKKERKKQRKKERSKERKKEAKKERKRKKNWFGICGVGYVIYHTMIGKKKSGREEDI